MSQFIVQAAPEVERKAPPGPLRLSPLWLLFAALALAVPVAPLLLSQRAPDLPELGQLPGTCAHFVIDRDGTIYQLVPLSVMCRHTVGLNYAAIGIEHVGTSDAEILHDPPQIRSSLLLTRWLMARFHVSLRNVIGHNESLQSPYHRELVARLRTQTHADWTRVEMDVYRARLRALAS